MTRGEIGEVMAPLPIDANAVYFGVPGAGWASLVDVDCRALIRDPGTRQKAIKPAVATINDELQAQTVIVGAETAGIPFATLIAQALDKLLAFVWKSRLDPEPTRGRRAHPGAKRESYWSTISRATDVARLPSHAMTYSTPRMTVCSGSNLTLQAVAGWDDLSANRGESQRRLLIGG